MDVESGFSWRVIVSNLRAYQLVAQRLLFVIDYITARKPTIFQAITIQEA
jgi:hypothetical protein